ncbi:MAG: 2-hydroxyacid dehydrogenase [Desulfobacterales bacterium]
MKKNIVVSYSPAKDIKILYHEALGGLGRIDFLPESKDSERIKLLEGADLMVALSFSKKEIDPREMTHLENLLFIQLVYAGADNLPFNLIPEDIIMAGNVGAFAEPIAEHVLALVLALAKNLLPRNKMLGEGRFERTGFNRQLSGGICGIIGFGGNGKAIARTMQAMDMKVYGINRSGKTDASIDFIGNTKDLKWVLESSDVVVVTTPLNRETRDLIGRKELEWMKGNTILINVGRGDVINQKALYDHLKSHPNFQAGIDTWWSEPTDQGELKLDFPFFELSNIIGSPHCADHVPRSMLLATRKAIENVKCFLLGNPIRGVLDRNDYR